MLLSVFTYSVRDRLAGILLGSLTIAVLLWFSLLVYADVDLTFYYDLPSALLDAMGISPETGGVGGIAFGAMYNLMGAMMLAGMAIAIGTAAIAGEEQDGTLGLLLGNPRSRSAITGSKIAALLALTSVGAVLLYAAGVLVPVLVGTSTEGVKVGALVVHLFANAVFWGMLALAIGAWTGQPAIAGGTAGSVMVVSWLAASTLPMLSGGDAIARFFPWYWFNSSSPEINGVNPAHLGVLLGASVALMALSLAGVNRRDLRSGGSRVTVLDRLRSNPRTAALADRIGGQARVSSITAKTATDHQGLTTVVGVVALSMGVLMPIFYTFLPDGTSEFFGQLPDSLIAMIGGVDMSTPEGFLQGEVFSITVPIAIITLTAVVGARALAGEEETRTMGLLLASAVPRHRVVLDKALAMVVLACVVGALTFAGSVVGVLLSRIDVSILNLLAISVLVTLLGIVFGAVALVVSAATGRVRWATGAAAFAGLAAYVVQSFLPLSQRYADWVMVSPFHFYLGSDPLSSGMPWGDAAVLLGVAVVLVAVAIPLFGRRDLRG
ncbi:MAG: ABC transporter permease subunit [Ornithinimicrobium sp.]